MKHCSITQQGHYHLKAIFSLCLILCSHFSQAGIKDDTLVTKDLKKLSLEELMNIEVISVSKRLEKLKEVASAIQVITNEDIRSSGVKTLPEALRLANNLQVAQANSSQWAISARGFNNVLANKLLVLIDGRTVYTPMYAGVFWDVQNLMLEDIDRIEVISGPGGTLWGANAVNGVINIITKSSKKTQGFYAEGAMGNTFSEMGSIRYGGKITENIAYRVYGTGFRMGNTLLTDSITEAGDKWTMSQGGFRMDWDPSENNTVSLQANIYGGNPNPDALVAVEAQGHNAVARWNHTISEKANFQLQAFYDYTWRDLNNGFTEYLKTYDIDWQNLYQLGERHVLNYGLGARLMDQKFQNLELFGIFPGQKTLNLYNVFVQDEMTLIKERLRFILGGKVEHNSYTGFEYQPNGRLTWTPTELHTIWSAVSRAVRTPSRFDREFALYLAPNFPYFTGSSDFISETVIAYELGWRTQPNKKLSLSLSTFYNVYDKLRSAEPGPPPFGWPITLGNGVKGETYGAELSATQQIGSWWRLRAGYTYLKKSLEVKPDSKDLNKAETESNDPAHQLLIQSTMNLPGRVELGTVFRYIDKLEDKDPAKIVPSYTALDLRLGWKMNEVIELNIVGQNLLDESHIEFIPDSPSPRRIPRTIYGKVIWRF